ncbi:MAG TPA: TIGR04141 family sporadically distributed protein [Erysipelotrichaceae bacterium]|nr:TIGR04141 family sporadically distributed protein [Erysipelotrichaceae bacterium]HQA84643.1 TIGR04141 family sporadically distributed protein [Erysipelotrichaceae bacterium]
MANRNKLSIYLIKEDFKKTEDIVESFSKSIVIDGVGTVFIIPSYKSTPAWINSFFCGSIDLNDIFTANARAVLLVSIPVDGKDKNRIFALTMGYGKHMLKENVVEERFGLKVTLNTIRQDSLRRISKVNIGGNQKISNEQLPLKSGITDFGLDINRDLVSNITGVSDDEDYVTGMISGGDMLSVTADVDINNIMSFLGKTYQKYSLSNYKSNFGWIDQIQEVRDKRLIEKLNSKLIAKINSKSTDIWMAVPEIINWSEIGGFKYSGTEVFDDINIETVIDSFKKSLKSVEQLKNKRIIAISAIDYSERYSWSANKCLFGELSINGNSYCINNGKWYCIDNDFVKEVDDDYKSTNISDIDFDDYTHEFNSESAYSQAFQKNHQDKYILMDAENISYGGGHSKIELCDILSCDGELIHIKPYSGSATLSHLFSQAAVSAELVISDKNFLSLANEKIAKKGNEKFQIHNRRGIKVVFGIISKKCTELPHLPFFSKVSFRHTKNRLQAFGLDVSIKNINDVRQ